MQSFVRQGGSFWHRDHNVMLNALLQSTFAKNNILRNLNTQIESTIGMRDQGAFRYLYQTQDTFDTVLDDYRNFKGNSHFNHRDRASHFENLPE